MIRGSAARLENADFDISASDSGIAVLRNPAKRRNVRILIADDNPTIMGMVKKILTARPEFDVVGEASDGQQAVILAESLKPDVIVINVTMPKMSGFEAARRIRAHVPDSAIVILSSHKDRQFIVEARKAGANGYVQKSDADGQLVNAIESTMKGGEFFVVE
jgi:DNA-binding NarL/FixJ family response regulator